MSKCVDELVIEELSQMCAHKSKKVRRFKMAY